MATDICPRCGKPTGAMVSGFDCCPGHSDDKTDPGASPNMVVTPTRQVESPLTPTSGFSRVDLTHGTKLSAGTLVGEYQIQERIGEGGMGTVYSAIHPIIGKKVAIKVLAGRLARNKNAIRRFVLEARAVNDIRHPGLVDIFSFGQLTDGRHYYVMEFLEGRDLGDVLRERICLPMAEAVPIFIEVGHALVAVHSKGIVHRDLKPENILLLSAPQPGGPRVKLVDFGLAKLVEGVPAHMREGAPSTAAGVNVGTPHYMSPEQCRGLKVDARADLYALGVLLYETLTGKLPFDGATPVDIWQAHAEKPPRPPIAVAPNAVSPALNAVILRLLAKQPENRFRSAAHFCAALENLNEDGQAKATPQPLRLGEPHDDVASTLEDLPAVPGAETVSTEEERRKEIEDLRANLGLHIEEPASVGEGQEQMSALVINLGLSHAAGDRRLPPLGGSHSLPLPVAGAKSGQVRHIEERKYVPPLAAPSVRPAPQRTAEGPTRGPDGLVRGSATSRRMVRVAAVALIVAAAVVAAVLLLS
ncbi:MAG: serine/threonine protein kinase [Deltaproteobacteria bacterium]|nr:serine/threonine protein kinase [Deltaproteobacteria bacterium]